jgi:hypothetical protein
MQNSSVRSVGRPSVRYQPAGASAVEHGKRQVAKTPMYPERYAGSVGVRPAGVVGGEYGAYSDPFGVGAGLQAADASGAFTDTSQNVDKSALSTGGDAGAGFNYQGASQLVTSLGQVGVSAVNMVLNQMNRDQLLQAQRDALAMSTALHQQGASLQTTQQATQTDQLLAMLSQRMQSLNSPPASSGMSTTTMVVVGVVALGAIYMFMGKGKRRNPFYANPRRRRRGRR